METSYVRSRSIFYNIPEDKAYIVAKNSKNQRGLKLNDIERR